MSHSAVMSGSQFVKEDEDAFEIDLKDMLKDGPNLGDCSSTVQSGSTDMDTSAGANQPQSFMRPDKPNLTRQIPPATSNIPLSSPERNGSHTQTGNVRPLSLPTNLGAANAAQGGSKLDSIRSWSINTYKCTRQMLAERFGKGTKTVDSELEARIESLRDTQGKYSQILRLARALSSHFHHVVQTQRAMGEAFSELAQKSPELQEEFAYNSETQKVLFKNGETLLGALNFFISSINTLCNKTMEDTLQTIKMYEAARVEFDAYRCDLDALQAAPHDAAGAARIDDARKKYAGTKDKYEKLKADVSIKLRFLDENRVKVTQRQFYLLHHGFQAYISGSNQDLEAVITQYNIQPGATTPEPHSLSSPMSPPLSSPTT